MDVSPHTSEPAALERLANALREAVSFPDGAGPDAAMDAIVDQAAAGVGVDDAWATVSLLRTGRFRTVASSDDRAVRADLLQYEMGAGPCVDAVLEDTVNHSPDVDNDQRWPQWGAAAAGEVGVGSVLSHRLVLLHDDAALAGLNLYSPRRGAFDPTATAAGLLFATHAALLVSARLAEQKAEQLVRALESNREVGVAMGVLMERHGLTRDQAFDVLRVASQDSNRKLAEVALEVGDTGHVPLRRWPPGVPGGPGEHG